MARTYTGKLEDFVRMHARYVSLHAAVSDTFTLATWADQEAHWRAVAGGHRRAHNLFAQVEPGTPLLCEPAQSVAASS